MRPWTLLNWASSIVTGVAALVLTLAGPAFDRPDLNKPALIVACIGAAVLILARRMSERGR